MEQSPKQPDTTHNSIQPNANKLKPIAKMKLWIKNNFWIFIIFVSALFITAVGVVGIIVMPHETALAKILGIILFILVIMVPVVVVPYVRFKLKEKKLRSQPKDQKLEKTTLAYGKADLKEEKK